MSAERRPARRPKLAVGHGYRSVSPVAVAAAAAGWCDLIWIVDSGDAEVIAVRRLLERLGVVVDIAGLGEAQAVRAVGRERPEGCLALRDDDLGVLAPIAQRLGLRFHDPDVAVRLADKAHQRAALSAGGICGPRTWPVAVDVGTVGGAGPLPAGVRYPAVLKPRRGSGSWHTFRVDDEAELVHLLETLRQLPGADEPLLLEEFLPSLPGAGVDGFADYVSVETVVSGGVSRHLAITGRLPLAEPFRETGFLLPADLGPACSTAVEELAGAAIRALGVTDGCLHTEVKFTPAGPRVIEVNGRIGGGIPDLLRLASGRDMLRLAMEAALDSVGPLEAPVACSRVGYRLFYQPPVDARVVVSVDGLDRVAGLPGVESVVLHRPPGSHIDARRGSRDHVFAVVGAAADQDEVLDINRAVSSLARVAYLGEHERAREDALCSRD